MGQREKLSYNAVPRKALADPKGMGDPRARTTLQSCPKLTQGGQAFIPFIALDVSCLWKEVCPYTR